MIIATHGIVASAAGIDADAQAFFDRVTTAGGSLSATEKTAVNKLVLDLKGYSIWSKMKAIYPMVGASSAACAQNLKSSSFTGTFNGGWTYASTGVTPNGTTGYMDTFFNPNTQLTTNNAHLSYYSRTQPTNTTNYFVEIGSSNTAIGAQGANYLQLYLKRLVQSNAAAFECNNWNSGIQAAFSNSDSRCMVIGSRTTSTSNKIYRNGTLQNTATSTNTSVNPNFNTYIGASNAAGTASNFSELQCAFASIGDGLTDTEAGNFYTAVQAFQTTLSRQV